MSAILRRWAKFSLVGATGILVQALMLVFFLRVAGLHYLAATALAVEMSVLHNFIWHRRYTWADREPSPVAPTLARFNFTVGAISLGGNLLLMFILVDGAGLNAYAANLATVAICSLVNFILSDRLVFT